MSPNNEEEEQRLCGTEEYITHRMPDAQCIRHTQQRAIHEDERTRNQLQLGYARKHVEVAMFSRNIPAGQRMHYRVAHPRDTSSW